MTASASTATEPPPRVLLVATSHEDLGDTGLPTGFHFSELTHSHEVFRGAGYAIDHRGRRPPGRGPGPRLRHGHRPGRG